MYKVMSQPLETNVSLGLKMTVKKTGLNLFAVKFTIFVCPFCIMVNWTEYPGGWSGIKTGVSLLIRLMFLDIPWTKQTDFV